MRRITAERARVLLIYVGVPPLITYFAASGDNMARYLQANPWVEYPAEGPRPPSSTKELREILSDPAKLAERTGRASPAAQPEKQ